MTTCSPPYSDTITPVIIPGQAVLDESTEKPDITPPPRRAITCFVDNNNHLIQQTLALRRSWLYSDAPDTDMVVMGPAEILDKLPSDLVRIPQRPATDDPVWGGYGYVNSIACMNGAGAEQLDAYTHLLRTDVDTFLLPGWNDFRPRSFVWGRGAYSNDPDIRQKLVAIAAEFGLTHRGHINVGSTWYGPTAQVRRVAALTELLTKYILTRYFATDKGAWPGWYAGVTLLYAGEIAVNHCAEDGYQSDLLDAGSTSTLPVHDRPHVHCWHTEDKFSKHWFMSGRYSREVDGVDLDLSIVRDYCMAMSLDSLDDMAAFTGEQP